MDGEDSAGNERMLRERIQDQVAFEKKAYKHVEKVVLSDSTEKHILQEVLNEIMPGHYADIVEERSISKLCGYPLCSNALSKVPHQKFHISVKKRRIYDITERKLFCSSQCYKCSKYVEAQIPESPLWLRKERKTIEFLEDVPEGGAEIKTKTIGDDKRLIEKASTLESPESFANECQRSLSLQSTNKQASWRNTLEKSDQFIGSHQPTASSCSDVARSRTKLIDLPEGHDEKPKDVDIEKLCDLLQGWCTVDTFEYLRSKIHGNDEKKEANGSIGLADGQGTSHDMRKRSADRFLRENKEWQSEIPRSGERPLVSKSFISPLIDSKSQHSIRRKIVSEKLKHSFSEVFSELCLSFADYKVDLASLIKTFRFTNQNITLRPKEWKVIATAFLHVISFQDKLLEESIDRRSKELEEIFKRCGIDQDKFKKLVLILNQRSLKDESNIADGEIIDCEYDNDTLD